MAVDLARLRKMTDAELITDISGWQVDTADHIAGKDEGELFQFRGGGPARGFQPTFPR